MASAGQDSKSRGVAADGGRGVRHRVRHGTEAGKGKIEAAKGKYAGSSAEHLWRRLDSMDFINRGILFAATLLLCFFPFLIVANALAGRSAASGLARHLGLNQQAAADVGGLFTSSAATSSAVTGTAWVFFILGGIAAATAVQGLYERAFELDSRGARDMLRRLIWLALLVGGTVLAGWAGPALRGAGGPVLLAVIGLVVFTGVWWFTIWFLLAGRMSWREVFPAAVATAVFWLGMEAVFSVIFSGTVISDDKKYGPIGVVFALMSWLIAIGVVIILGAVTGIVWQERNLSFRAAFKKLRRDRSAQEGSRKGMVTTVTARRRARAPAERWRPGTRAPPMSEAAAALADPGATIRSKSYRVLLVLAAVIGVLVSFASWSFLELLHWIQTEVYQSLPSGLGFHIVPWWWPLPVLAVAGVLTAVAIVRLPGRGGHIPYEGIKAGTAKPAELPGILLTVITLLLTSKAGIATAPLIIVAVVVAYLTIETLSAARGPAPAAAPAAEPQPAAPSHTSATANPADSQA